MRFVNDVGENYMTFPPRGHGNELGKNAVDDLKEEVLLKGDADGDGFEAHEIYKSDVHRRHDEKDYWQSKNSDNALDPNKVVAPTTAFVR